ncbi:MAG: hypothetical protein IKD69_13215, partial [Solobacterium sp.]|nr:hypothetical protein [Solobacterium sp.]
EETVHVAMIVGLERTEDGSHVVSATVAEAAKPGVKTTVYSRQALIQLIQDRPYHIYRYAGMNEISPAYSKWADTNAKVEINPYLCPRRGDHSNWPASETVEIDVLDQSTYVNAELYRNGKLFSTQKINGSCIAYEDLPGGKYEVFLANGDERTDPVSFIVVDTEIAVKQLGNGKYRLDFASTNGTPIWYGWCYASDNRSKYMSLLSAYELSKKEKEEGSAIVSFQKGKWLLKVEFETEYGLISSEFAEVEIK